MKRTLLSAITMLLALSLSTTAMAAVTTDQPIGYPTIREERQSGTDGSNRETGPALLDECKKIAATLEGTTPDCIDVYGCACFNVRLPEGTEYPLRLLTPPRMKSKEVRVGAKLADGKFGIATVPVDIDGYISFSAPVLNETCTYMFYLVNCNGNPNIYHNQVIS